MLQPSPLNEKVLKEKRKKLKETFDRVMRLLHEDEPEQWSEFKRKEVEYEKRRYKRQQYFESVRNAEQVNIEDIPLPSSTNDKPNQSSIPKINLPPPVLLTNVPAPSSIKKFDDFSFPDLSAGKEKEPPGVPMTLPPNLFEMLELDSDYESDSSSSSEEEAVKEPPKDKHDKNIEDFMKEVESAQKKKEEEKMLESIRVDPTPDVDREENREQSRAAEVPRPAPEPAMKPHEMIPIPQMPLGMPRMAHPLMFRPPPMRQAMPMGIRMPPGPPPNRPNMPGMGMNRMGIRMAPGPPAGPPPRHKMHHHHDRNAPPKDPKSATITAKPQIRNLSADVTRFVPATLRIKRDEPKRPKPKSYIPETRRQPSQQQPQPTKDDAYQQFMSELQDFL